MWVQKQQLRSDFPASMSAEHTSKILYAFLATPQLLANLVIDYETNRRWNA
jgi:hypothetical protein